MLELARRFDPKARAIDLAIGVDARQIYRGFGRRARLYLQVRSKELPHAQIRITKAAPDDTWTTWNDGVTDHDENRLGGPASLDDIPRWVAASARKLGVTWDPTTVHVQSNLRGKARKAAVDWLLGG